MNERRYVIPLGKKKKQKAMIEIFGMPYASGHIRPHGKFWKRFFNKKVRKGATHKRGNWFEWS